MKLQFTHLPRLTASSSEKSVERTQITVKQGANESENVTMVQTLRKPEIINIARRDGMVTVEGLVKHFGVTPQTTRRDLSELANSGQLDRVHGGAILPSTTVNIGYRERQNLNQSSKVDIARVCAAEIPNDCSIFLNIGTTTEAVAEELLQHEGLLVVTNNINVSVILSANPNIEVVVTGGYLRRSDGELVGDLAKEAISRFRFDFAVIGCSALHEEGDILDFDFQEVGVSQAITKRSEKVLLVADAPKFGRKAPAKIASLSDVDIFFSDKEPPPACVLMCSQSGTHIHLVTDEG